MAHKSSSTYALERRKNPYKIWLSETILQQTRVAQGLPYYQKFLSRFPDIFSLADASDDEVMKQWEGLGYYSRARNLHHAAKILVQRYEGQLPDSYDELIKLPGIGPYTAAAIASFAFGKPTAVLDGNVHRILSRYFAIAKRADNIQDKRTFTSLANNIIDPSRPGAFNQAIMDFGADICLASSPKCSLCPLTNTCAAFTQNMIEELPPPRQKIKKKDRFFHYFILINQVYTYITKRSKRDIWKNLWEFPMIETNSLMQFKELRKKSLSIQILNSQEYALKDQSQIFKQQLTHQRINAVFFIVAVPKVSNIEWKKVNREAMANFAFPRIIHSFLNKKTLDLFI